MEKHKYMYTLIESAMGNGIRYIEDNPQRGIRNLLDLGEYFASGRFQKSFFDIAHEMLNNENSFYYYKIGDLVRNTNHRTLANFGINLGYNSFTYGASKIREYEKNLKLAIYDHIKTEFVDNNQLEYEATKTDVKKPIPIEIKTKVYNKDNLPVDIKNEIGGLSARDAIGTGDKDAFAVQVVDRKSVV